MREKSIYIYRERERKERKRERERRMCVEIEGAVGKILPLEIKHFFPGHMTKYCTLIGQFKSRDLKLD